MKKSYLDTLLSGDEKIILSVHQHWWTLVSAVLLKALLFVVVLAATTTGVYFYLDQLILLSALGLTALLILVIAILRDFIRWTNREYIITNRRVVQLSGILNKRVIDSSLEKVNDIKMDQSLFGQILGYGDIEILTASESGINRFERIDNPIRFKTALLNAKVKLEHEINRPPEVDRPYQPDIIRMIDRLNNLRERGALTEDEFQQKKTDLLKKI